VDEARLSGIDPVNSLLDKSLHNKQVNSLLDEALHKTDKEKEGLNRTA